MATKKTDAPEDDLLQKAAKAIGSTLGAVAGKTGIDKPAETESEKPPTPELRVDKPPKKSGKLIGKEKTREPRKEKKKRQKAAAKKSL